MSYEAEEADAANNHGQDDDWDNDLDRLADEVEFGDVPADMTFEEWEALEAEMDAAERATAHPIESACVVYYGTVMFGEALIHPEP